MHPTKLPDELYPDDPDWKRADYAGRVALLLAYLGNSREMWQHTVRQLASAVGECETLHAELRAVREVNAGLVLEIEKLTKGQ